MKEQYIKKQSINFLTILLLVLGISITCAVSDDKDGNTPPLTDTPTNNNPVNPTNLAPTNDVVDPLIDNTPVDPIILADFRNNFAGTYTVTQQQ